MATKLDNIERNLQILMQYFSNSNLLCLFHCDYSEYNTIACRPNTYNVDNLGHIDMI